MNNAPECEDAGEAYTVPERSLPGVAVASLAGTRASDKDGTPLAFTILYGNDEGHFVVNSSSGVLAVARPLSGVPMDFERRRQYVIVVQAEDPEGLQCSIEVRAAVVVLCATLKEGRACERNCLLEFA